MSTQKFRVVSAKELGKVIHEELVKDCWGSIDLDDFIEGGEYFDDMEPLLDRVIGRVEGIWVNKIIGLVAER